MIVKKNLETDPSTAEFEISAFTCTYNRIETLRRTYESLRMQTVRNFEWIVYDNGSNDTTVDEVKRWQSEADFPIVLMGRPDNSGVQRSFNYGLKVARGFFWLTLDSDDVVVPEAFERLVALWAGIPESRRPEFTGVTVNCVDQHNNLVGHEFPVNPTDSNSVEMFYRYKMYGEKFGMHRVNVLRQYPFPDTSEHVNPGVVWWAIAKDFQTRYANERLRVYFIEEEGREDQLSFHTSLSSNAYGRRMNHMFMLNEHIDWFKTSPIQFFKHAGIYGVCSIALKMPFSEMIGFIKPLRSKLLVSIMHPFMIGVYFVESRRK